MHWTATAPKTTEFSRSRWQSLAFLLPALSLQSLAAYKSNCAPLKCSDRCN